MDQRAELERVLESPEFRQSEQSKKLLRYLVDMSLQGASEQLRERAIGAAIFGLEPGYDTTENPIVRVRANELRKRLARYYQQHGEEAAVRFEIPSGGYRVEFRTMDKAAEAKVIETPHDSGKVSRRWWLTGAGGVLAAGGVATLVLRMRGSLLELFWEPALRSGGSVILCSGHPVVYRFSREAQQRIQGRSVDHFEGQTVEVRPDPGMALQGSDVVAIPDQYIGLGSAEAVARIYGWLQRRRKDADIRFGNDLNFSDLRQHPVVLIGAFSNRWTMEFMRDLRFRFDTGEKGPQVTDTQTGKSWALSDLQENGRTKEDYVLVTRLLKSPTGEFLIAGAGITQYGGRTVAEVLTNEATLQAMLAGSSSAWPKRNLQILTRVNVLGHTAGPPERIAVHEW